MRQLPSVDAVLQHATALVAQWGSHQVTAAIKSEIAKARRTLSDDHYSPTASLNNITDLNAEQANKQVLINTIITTVGSTLANSNEPSLRQMINLTGTVLHTNLGRAILPQRAIEAVARVASTPNNLEYDVETGGRGDRDCHVEPLICELTGAEAATVVNNNAAAVLLVLNTLANNAEVPVSRGELVEIGGSFRIPEVMQRANCRLIEVGATNRTHVKDYQQAINSATALLMKVHTSNFCIEGFTKAVSEVELATLAHQHQLPLVVDLGSGNLIDFTQFGLPPEPTAATSINNGADIITFSGDKLLGGPQCGIIAGRKALLNQIRQNPLKRALRLDKMTLAALEEVLKMYRNPESLCDELPTLRYLTREATDIKAQATKLLPLVAAVLPPQYTVESTPCNSQIGSGALPVASIDSHGLVIKCLQDVDLRRLSDVFRQLPRPVIGRMNDGKFWLDLRCLDCEAVFIEQLDDLAPLLT